MSEPDNPGSAAARPLRSVAKARAITFIAELGINVALPFAIYSVAEPKLGEIHALMLSCVPPLLCGIVEFVRRRRIDAISMLSITGIALSLLAFAGGGSVQLLQLREKLVTGIIGIVFLGSAIAGHPLVYILARAGMARKSKADSDRFDALSEKPAFKRGTTLITIVWGVGLLVDFVASAILVFTLSIREYLLVNPLLGYATIGGLSLWTFWYAKRSGINGPKHSRDEGSR